jgi:hypothetical protein
VANFKKSLIPGQLADFLLDKSRFPCKLRGMMERVIFLDFDGVIVTPRTQMNHLDHTCMEHLKRITDETGAVIVVSSVWRKYNSFRALKALFEPFGLFGRVVDITPVLPGDHKRGEEIEEWLKRTMVLAEVKSFVILDDDSDMEPNMDRLVQTKTQKGLTAEDAEKCIEMLKSS